MQQVHQEVAVSVFFNVAIVVSHPRRRPRLHYFKPVAAVFKPLFRVPHMHAVFPSERRTVPFFRNPLPASVSAPRLLALPRIRLRRILSLLSRPVSLWLLPLVLFLPFLIRFLFFVRFGLRLLLRLGLLLFLFWFVLVVLWFLPDQQR